MRVVLFFKKQILHKSIINLCFALSTIAAEHHLEQIFRRPVLIGRSLFGKKHLKEHVMRVVLFFKKQILHKSIIDLCYALSSIAAEIHLAACTYRTANIGY